MNYFNLHKTLNNLDEKLNKELSQDIKQISPKDKLKVIYQSHHKKITFDIYNYNNILKDIENKVNNEAEKDIKSNISIENKELKLIYYSRDNLDSEKVKGFFDKLMVYLSSEIN